VKTVGVAIGAGLAVLVLWGGAARAGMVDCAQPKAPVETLVCRDVALLALDERMEKALAALNEAVGDLGRTGVAAAQRDWIKHRDEACPVTAADLTNRRKQRERAACVAGTMRARAAKLEAELVARNAPVGPVSLSIGDAAPLRLPAAVQASAAPPRRPAAMAALTGRWSKAEPATGRPLDDCRAAYLEFAGGGAFTLRDPRIPGLPVDGTVAGGDAMEGAALVGESGVHGRVRLDSAEAAHLDGLTLTLNQPFAFGATFVRCR